MPRIILLLSLLTISPSHASFSPPIVNRRQSIALGAASCGLFIPCASKAEDAPPSTFTAMDAFQLKASYNGLNDALQAWRTEIALIQLGNEPTSVVAVAGLSDGQLQHFSESGVKLSVEEFKKRKNALLQMLYLARGAARYENDPAVANDYIEKAKVEAEGARDELGTIAKALGVELKRSASASSAVAAGTAEDRIVFTPRTPDRVVFTP